MITWMKSLAKWLKSQKPGAATKAREQYQDSKQSPHGKPRKPNAVDN